MNELYLRRYFSAKRNKKATLKYVNQIVKQEKDIKLEIGAEQKRGNGWITIDRNYRCDIHWDLQDGIPFPDASVIAVYASHFMEHLTYKEGQKMLAECKRVLKPNGTLLLTVPNSRLYIETYVNNDAAFLKDKVLFDKAWNNTTKLDYVNYMAHMDGHHKYMFDEENLLKVMEKAGFKNAKLRSFNAEIDLAERDFESIYSEATA
jgi:predicted SAM-dependent methyltransferase